MNDEIIYPNIPPDGPRVSNRASRERLIRAIRFRNRSENIGTCLQCKYIKRDADCAACMNCIQRNIAIGKRWRKNEN